MMNSRAFLLALIAASALAARVDAVTIETNGRHSRNDDSDHNSLWEGSFGHHHFGGDLQTWLNNPSTQTFLRDVSSSVHDPAVSGLLNNLINSNFQLDPTVTADFQSWLQDHHFQLDSNRGARFDSWIHDHEGDRHEGDRGDGEKHHSHDGHGGDTDDDNNGVNLPVAVPEPSSLMFLLSGALSLGIYAARRK